MTQNKSQTVFKNDIFIPSDVSKFFYEVMLPAGSGLPKDESAISPSGYETATDGRRILLFWNRGSLSGGQVFSANIVYEQVSIIQGVLLGPYAQILLIGGLIGVGGLVFYLLRKRSMLQIVMPILKDDEKRIFEAIMKHGKVVHQKLIVRDSNYSKAKVSKVLKSLEQRGLVKLERVGRSNKVHMMKNFPEKEEKVPGNN
jgi:predicted transcriptional regulator